jgi:hypothetical protein
MDKQQEQLETYLREFEPQRPRPLPVAVQAPKVRRAAAGALLIALCAGALWLASRRTAETAQGPAALPALLPSAQEVSLSSRQLTRLALEHPGEFEEVLTAASRRLLPTFDGKDSTLRVLAKP